MKIEHIKCNFCGTEITLFPIAFMCPECGMRHFFEIDRASCTNELLVPEVKCPRESVPRKKKRKGTDPTRKPGSNG